MSELKKELYKLCVDYVQNSMNTSIQAINEAQQASSEETKSSAGDKYETGRAMMQQETNRNQAQLNEASKLMVVLNRLSGDIISKTAEAGSLVITNNGKFYITISAGTLMINGEAFFAISAGSPIGLKLKGLKKGDEFSLNGKLYRIEDIT